MLVADRELRARLGAESRRIIDAYTIPAAADGIIAAATNTDISAITMPARDLAA